MMSDTRVRDARAALTRFLWSNRDAGSALDFVQKLRAELLAQVEATRPELADQVAQVDAMQIALEKGGALEGTSKAELGRRDGAPKQLNLLTLHSAKGTEYDLVIILGLDQGSFPSPSWSDNTLEKMEEAKRLFYVGITRAREEVHLLYSGFEENKYGKRFYNGPSEFLNGI
jgi:DNA helicase-2/ATP-dependent DNA helicase PcrA